MQRVILVVGCNVDLRETITHALRGGSYLVLAISDGTMVLDIARYSPVALIILDPASLQPSGLVLSRQLRACEQTAHVPILWILRNETELAQIKERRAQLSGYLVSPFTEKELLTHARSLLRGRIVQRVILVVERDAALRESITRSLLRENYLVLATGDEAKALDMAQHNPIALIILDPPSLQPDGLVLSRQLRACEQTAHVPMLMMIGDEEEIPWVERMGVLANDYLVKPFQWEELRACVSILLRGDRRSVRLKRADTPSRTVPARKEGEVLIADDLYIDMSRQQVTRGDRQITLGSRLLFDLLVYLVRHRGVVLGRDQLLRQVWGSGSVRERRKVDVYVHWLRQRLQDDPDHPQLIQTVPGVGYRFKD